MLWLKQRNTPCRGWVRDMLKSITTPTHPGPGPSLASDIWWSSLVGTEGRTVGKRAVRILLECFLVNRDSSVSLTLSDWCKMAGTELAQDVCFLW